MKNRGLFQRHTIMIIKIYTVSEFPWNKPQRDEGFHDSMDNMHMNHNISNIYSHTNQYNDNNIKHHKLHCPVRIT